MTDYKPKMDPALSPPSPPNNAKMWGAVSGALSSCAVAITSSPIPWPWNVVVGGVCAAASAVTAMVAAKRFDAGELAKFLSLLAEAKDRKFH
jgi:CBS-domain-containing membrane protein